MDGFNGFNQILSGHLNEVKSKLRLTSKEKEAIFEFRKKICDNCALKKDNICNPKKWIHPETKETSKIAKKGFVRGCGCRLSAKQKAFNARCPAGFWGGEECNFKRATNRVGSKDG